MKRGKKIQKKLQSRLAAHSRIEQQCAHDKKTYNPDAFRMPGSRNGRKAA